jgi:hypothetical protein
MRAKVLRRAPGRCQDCGWEHKPVRRVTFWVNGMRYQVCAECERAYRRVINWPVTEPPKGTGEGLR